MLKYTESKLNFTANQSINGTKLINSAQALQLQLLQLHNMRARGAFVVDFTHFTFWSIYGISEVNLHFLGVKFD